MEKGEQIGIQKASRHLAVQLFGLKLSDARIAEMTGLSETEVASLWGLPSQGA
jgi:hypothetical protein